MRQRCVFSLVLRIPTLESLLCATTLLSMIWYAPNFAMLSLPSVMVTYARPPMPRADGWLAVLSTSCISIWAYVLLSWTLSMAHVARKFSMLCLFVPAVVPQLRTPCALRSCIALGYQLITWKVVGTVLSSVRVNLRIKTRPSSSALAK